MSKFSARAAAALERLPEDMQERVVAYILEEADKRQALRDAVALGMADIEAGRIVEWHPGMFDDMIEAAAKEYCGVKVTLSQLAVRDLSEMLTAIARENKHAAKLLDLRFAERFKQPARSPYIGRQRVRTSRDLERAWLS